MGQGGEQLAQMSPAAQLKTLGGLVSGWRLRSCPDEIHQFLASQVGSIWMV
jgi:hypothetical protein